MYLKIIKNSKIKESIYCYWCSIYEEEIIKAKEEDENMETFLDKVAISELNTKKYQKRMFLTIENNKRQILETGTEIDFIEISDYINENKNEKKELEKLYKYFGEDDDNVLLVGIKIKKIKEWKRCKNLLIFWTSSSIIKRKSKRRSDENGI